MLYYREIVRLFLFFLILKPFLLRLEIIKVVKQCAHHIIKKKVVYSSYIANIFILITITIIKILLHL